MKRVVGAVALAVAGLVGGVAGAQEPTMLFQSPWPLAPNPQLATHSLLLMGEPSGPMSLSPWVASIPLRLSLQGGIFPMAGAFPNCASYEDPSGNSFQGWPVQRYALVSLTPNLTLHGFSSAGCPIDGAIGGGATYGAPLGKAWWLVTSGGFYGVPPHDSLPARKRTDFRVDFMKAAPDGRSVSIGVGRRGVSLGGSF